MNRQIINRRLQQREINARAANNPAAFVREETARYEGQLDTLADRLAAGDTRHRLVMLSGPSSAGKTTTSALLCDRLRRRGVDTHMVSMDDFYRGRGQAPLLDNGQYDYEALEALRLDDLENCMRDLLERGETRLPRFDFTRGEPAEDTVPLVIAEHSLVIFEGIHAINPRFREHLAGRDLFTVFVNTVSPIYDGDAKRLARRDLRLTRRMLRDERFRSSAVAHTLTMWEQVVRGENTYMFPFIEGVDCLIDTTHAYEPCLFAPLLLPLLREVANDHPLASTARHLETALGAFVPLSLSYLPADSLLREFVG